MFIYFKTRQLIRAMCHDSLFEQCAMITFSSNRLRAIGNRHSMNRIFERINPLRVLFGFNNFTSGKSQVIQMPSRGGTNVMRCTVVFVYRQIGCTETLPGRFSALARQMGEIRGPKNIFLSTFARAKSTFSSV